MNSFELTDKNGKTFNVVGKRLASVAALNHDDTVRSTMRLFKTKDGYVCELANNPHTNDAKYQIEHCDDILSVYQFFGTLPLANYLYGAANLTVPGLIQIQD